MTDSLDALQDLHQLSLLVWSHAGKHSGSECKLQRHRVERQRITATSKQHEARGVRQKHKLCICITADVNLMLSEYVC